jgi:hypothetical protein
MVQVLKPIANSVSVGTTNTAINYKLVYLVNTDTVVSLISLFDPVANAQYATTYIPPNTGVGVQLKSANTLITANGSGKVFATPAGFEN